MQKQIMAHCLALLVGSAAMMALSAPVHAATKEHVQFYTSPGHAAAVAKGATAVPSCGAGDVCGLALKFDTKTVGTITATGTTPKGAGAVIEDIHPQYGGLGVVGTGSDSLDNIGKGEKLTLKFDRVVDLSSIVFFDSDHLADFYHSSRGNAEFSLTVVHNGLVTTGTYDLVNVFNAGTAFVGNEFIFGGLQNDLTVNGKVEHMSYYVGGFDVATHVNPPIHVPEPGSIALFAAAMLAFGATRRRMKD